MVGSQLWTHDCEACIPLGPYSDGGVKYDLYFCGGESVRRDTVIARYGSDGPQYCSGIEAARSGQLPQLTEAMNRAAILGLLREDSHVSSCVAERPVQRSETSQVSGEVVSAD
jgi:hypothetical protein